MGFVEWGSAGAACKRSGRGSGMDVVGRATGAGIGGYRTG